MDKRKMKIAYSDKYNQFYEILRIDNDVGACYIKPTVNRRDKSIHKDMILRVDKEDLKVVVMYNSDTTAESHFIKIMESNCPYKIKLSELRDFKKNMLRDSIIAMEELKKISEMQISDHELQEVKSAALKLLYSMKERENVIEEDYQSTYDNQVIPDKTMKIALSKRLFIERSDEIYQKRRANGKKVLAIGNKKYALQKGRPCGFIVRDRGGFIIDGKGYTFSIQDVVDFVKNYIPTEKEKQYTVLYEVPISERKERQLAKCAFILRRHGLHYNNEHNYFFWVLDRRGNVIAGGENGFGFKWLKKYCIRLNNRAFKRVTDKLQRSNK